MTDYLLVKNDCDSNGESTIVYEVFGTADEVREVMHDEYQYELAHGSWDECEFDTDMAYVGVATHDFDRHISWWRLDIGEDFGDFVLVGAEVVEGCPTVRVIGRYESANEAQTAMQAVYAYQMSHKFLDYWSWDPEYSSIDDWSAECGIETMDAGYYLNILTVSYWEQYVGFEYLG